MTTELAARDDDARSLSSEVRDLWKRMYCQGASDTEAALFIRQCLRTGLNPEDRQIYAIRRRVREGDRWTTKLTPQVSIDGLRLVAQRTGRYRGQDGPYWCDAESGWLDVWLKDEPPLAARVGVYHADFDRPLYAVARYRSYCQRNDGGQPLQTWLTMPDIMLAKCAEALALRKAFPHETSGLYTTEEMAHVVEAEVPEPDERERAVWEFCEACRTVDTLEELEVLKSGLKSLGQASRSQNERVRTAVEAAQERLESAEPDYEPEEE